MTFSLDGLCTCGEIRYRITHSPLFVHCCHCSWCQRESGSAFAINALIESEFITLLDGAPETTLTPSLSGKSQQVSRCPSCRVALWSNYSAAGDAVRFLRVGTLETPSACPPDIHIFTSSKQSWLTLDGDTPVVDEYYRRSSYWPADSVARYKKAISLA